MFESRDRLAPPLPVPTQLSSRSHVTYPLTVGGGSSTRETCVRASEIFRKYMQALGYRIEYVTIRGVWKCNFEVRNWESENAPEEYDLWNQVFDITRWYTSE